MFAILFDIKMLKSETLALLYQIDIILTSLHVMCFTQYIHKIQLFIFSKGHDPPFCSLCQKIITFF